METKSVYSAGPLDRNVMRLAALFVQPDGCYAGLPGVDAWPEHRGKRVARGQGLEFYEVYSRWIDGADRGQERARFDSFVGGGGELLPGAENR